MFLTRSNKPSELSLLSVGLTVNVTVVVSLNVISIFKGTSLLLSNSSQSSAIKTLYDDTELSSVSQPESLSW